MAKRVEGEKRAGRRRPPALTPEENVERMIGMAYDAAEEKLKNKTASSQLIIHFLTMSSDKTRLEKEKLERENELLRAKTESLRSAKNTEELYRKALKAMASYSGGFFNEDQEVEEDEED